MGMMTAERSAPSTGELISSPTWTILIPTLGQRRDSFQRLLDHLLPQTEPYGGQVQVVALWNNGERRIAEVRQDLLDYGDAEYRCFIDDDDMVSGDYVLEIMRALESRPQIVGFDTEITFDGRNRKLAVTSLEYKGFGTLRSNTKAPLGLYRDIVHLCPIETKLARLGSFGDAPVGHAEDMWWIIQMRRLKMTNYEYIDKTLYYYQYSRFESSHRLKGGVWSPQGIIPGQHQQLKVDHENFSYHPWESSGKEK